MQISDKKMKGENNKVSKESMYQKVEIQLQADSMNNDKKKDKEQQQEKIIPVMATLIERKKENEEEQKMLRKIVKVNK